MIRCEICGQTCWAHELYGNCEGKITEYNDYGVWVHFCTLHGHPDDFYDTLYGDD